MTKGLIPGGRARLERLVLVLILGSCAGLVVGSLTLSARVGDKAHPIEGLPGTRSAEVPVDGVQRAPAPVPVGQYAPWASEGRLAATSATQPQGARASGEQPVAVSQLERFYETEDVTYVAIDDLVGLEGWDEQTAENVRDVISDSFAQIAAIATADTPAFPGDPTSDDITKGLYQELRALIGAEGTRNLLIHRDALIREKRGLPPIGLDNAED